MEFRILGRTRLLIDSRPVDLGTTKQRALLALLLLHAGRPVGIGLIIDQLWPDRPHDEVKNILQTLVSRLRTILKRAGVPFELSYYVNAYRIELDPQLVDYHRFRRRVEDSRFVARAGDHALATKLLRDAVEMWCDRPLLDLDTDWAERRRRQMEESDLRPAQYALIESMLAVAEYGDALKLLGPLMDDHPVDETFARQRMQALDGLGRPAEAISFYSQFRRQIVSDLGAEPGPELQATHRKILNRRTSNSDQPSPAIDHVAAAPNRLRPWQLPRATGITGRDDLLARLDALLLGAGAEQPAPVVALHGMAGVGKTALAAAWGWSRRDRFPDGCLFINFYGYLPDQHVSADDAIARFLDALGVPPAEIPTAGPRRADKLNQLLSGSRTLVVLDNVKDPVHVRPVLSATSACPVLVISRSMPTGLVRDGVSSVPVTTLSEHNSVALLRRDIVDVRADDDPTSIRALASLSGGLPFALKLIGQYAANRPRVRLVDIARQLDSNAALLKATGNDEWDSLQGAFLMSFNALPSEAAALFLVLGLHPRPSFGRDAASALFGASIGDTERQLNALTEVHLLEPEGSHRYRFHDLLHAYSADRAHAELSAADRRAAVERVVDFYCRSASNAWRRLIPHSSPLPPLPATTDAVPVDFCSDDTAFQWCTEERSNLIAATRLAAEYDLHEYAWRIPAAIGEIVERSGYRGDGDDFVGSVRLAIESAKLTGNREAEIGMLNYLGGSFFVRHDYRNALVHFEHALAAAKQTRDPEGLPVSLLNVGSAYLKLGDICAAIRLYRQALELERERDAADGVAWCLHQIGVAHRCAEQYDEALHCLHQALSIREDIKDVRGQGDTLIELGALHRDRGEYDLARDHCLRALDANERSHDTVKAAQALTVLAMVHCVTRSWHESAEYAGRALRLCEFTGDRLARARALHVRGRALDGLGDRGSAIAAWSEAIEIFDDMGDLEAELVRARVDGVQ